LFVCLSLIVEESISMVLISGFFSAFFFTIVLHIVAWCASSKTFSAALWRLL
jgi:hypothetical protein